MTVTIVIQTNIIDGHFASIFMILNCLKLYGLSHLDWWAFIIIAILLFNPFINMGKLVLETMSTASALPKTIILTCPYLFLLVH